MAPFAATGTVQFKDPHPPHWVPRVRVRAGYAIVTSSALGKGTHSLTAMIIPTNPVAFGPSSSPPVSLTVLSPVIAI
ncbi:MAG: Ig-like domain-containing protein [Actinomycetota bacterium]|nr:Ig-like domain-containing protein [Actinomycetota bacterium]